MLILKVRIPYKKLPPPNYTIGWNEMKPVSYHLSFSKTSCFTVVDEFGDYFEARKIIVT